MQQRASHCIATIAMGLCLIACTAGPVKAQVTTRNAAGYVKITIKPGTLVDPKVPKNNGEVQELSELILTTGDDLIQSTTGQTEHNTVSATLTGNYNDGTSSGTFQLDGTLSMDVFGKAGSTTGAYQTEIVAMTLSGSVGPTNEPWVIRESPTLDSLGQLSVTDLTGGWYSISNTSNIFIEMSIDNGLQFEAQTNGPTPFVLIPEPTALGLLSIGGLVLIRRNS